MSTKNEQSRITLDIPKAAHRKLKSRAAIMGKSMREIILQAIALSEECILSDHQPNKQTLKAIENIEKNKNLVEAKNIDDLFKKLSRMSH